MITLNSKTGSFVSANMQPIDTEDKQPCWYADIERGSNRKEYKWKVGCKYDGKDDQYSFKFSKVGNVNDENFWERISGVDFAIELIDLFREGGQKAVKEWVDGGCP